MAAVWSVINDALATLKELWPEMRMNNVHLMGFLIDWEAARPPIIQFGSTENQHSYWPGGDVHKGNMTVAAKWGGGGVVYQEEQWSVPSAAPFQQQSDFFQVAKAVMSYNQVFFSIDNVSFTEA